MRCEMKYNNKYNKKVRGGKWGQTDRTETETETNVGSIEMEEKANLDGWIATAVEDLTGLDACDSGHGQRCDWDLKSEEQVAVCVVL